MIYCCNTYTSFFSICFFLQQKMPTLLEALEQKYGTGGMNDFEQQEEDALVSIFVPKLLPLES